MYLITCTVEVLLRTVKSGEYNIVGKRIGLKLSRGVGVEGVGVEEAGVEGVGVGGEKERGNKKQEGSLGETFFCFL